jgi:hypothetical protein
MSRAGFETTISAWQPKTDAVTEMGRRYATRLLTFIINSLKLRRVSVFRRIASP